MKKFILAIFLGLFTLTVALFVRKYLFDPIGLLCGLFSFLFVEYIYKK